MEKTMTAKKSLTIGILTGGGDVPGLNPCIRELVYRGIEEGLRVVGFRRGWAGLLEFNPEDPESREQNIIELDRVKVRTIDRSGGTYLHTRMSQSFSKNRQKRGNSMTSPSMSSVTWNT
jgi:6-phosphofructokinase 1